MSLFITTYLANNPQGADLDLPFGWSPRLATAVLGPLNAMLAAIMTGVLAWVIGRIRAGRSG